MKHLIIVGAGGFGREVCSWALQCSEFRRDWDVVGFLDDDPDALAELDHPLPVLDSIASYKPRAGDIFVSGIGAPRIRNSLLQPLLEKGATFTRLIHPTVVVGDRVELGEGVILCPGATLTCDLIIGDFVAVNLKSAVGHDASIGAFSQISSFCDIMGGAEIGREVLVGSHAAILPNIRVGHRAIVGAGSTVVQDVHDKDTVFGNPAQVVRT